MSTTSKYNYKPMNGAVISMDNVTSINVLDNGTVTIYTILIAGGVPFIAMYGANGQWEYVQYSGPGTL